MKTVFIKGPTFLSVRRCGAGAAAVTIVAAACSCSSTGARPPPPPPSGVTEQTLQLDVAAVDTTFVTRDHFIASVEMQLSGEPFAEAMGRDLAGYSRDFFCQSSRCAPDQRLPPSPT